MFRSIFLLLLLIVTTFIGCGQIMEGGGQNFSLSPQPDGMYVDTTTEDFLMKQYDELKSCANFKKGEFKELSIVFMPPRFPCKWYDSGCGGEFIAPNTIKISNTYYWKHELIHYFLYEKNGNPDPEHKSDLYEKCA